MEFPDLPARVAAIRATITRHQAAGGWSHPVTIVAVTKTHGAEAVRAAWVAGLTDVGENRVQEAASKAQGVRGDVHVKSTLAGVW